ncbi:MAG: class I SAM-dependent methyltransferase [Leptospiraceae bacterium]|nr:class I SAM-dependent methyltransferase [Leptospiraceae bacterium]MCP5513123.1 class I SAM-dependent methyltransferase [Leptospiraceae bacterium]
MNDFWNQRYSSEAFAYGEEPNSYLKEKISRLEVGRVLFPCDGEGRNGVFAAGQGFEVVSFDSSEKGKEKALGLAKKKNVSLTYLLQSLEETRFKDSEFDGLVLIYAHFPPHLREAYHRKMSSTLKKGGFLILEGFHKKQIENQKTYNSGGPGNPDMLFSKEELLSDFSDFEFLEFLETEVDLMEGEFHKGKAFVIRILGRKK